VDDGPLGIAPAGSPWLPDHVPFTRLVEDDDSPASTLVARTLYDIAQGFASPLDAELSDVAGGLVPLAPRFVLREPLRRAWQTALVGGRAAAAAFGIAKSIA